MNLDVSQIGDRKAESNYQVQPLKASTAGLL
jgi:hypothetical protein